jgi:signal peptidase I
MQDQVHDPEPRDEEEPVGSHHPWSWEDPPQWFKTTSAHAMQEQAPQRLSTLEEENQIEQDSHSDIHGVTDSRLPKTEWHLVEEPGYANGELGPHDYGTTPPSETGDQENPTHERERPRTNWKGVLREIAETAILTLLIFVLMRAVVQNYRIEGYSMEPNLHEQEYLIVNKISYYLGEPQRGDIIVFEFPGSHLSGPEKDYIKRVIGLPGDTVECRPGEILVNGQVIDEPYDPNPGSYYCPPTVLGPSEYFVLGDNRNQSSDSHSWGPLERRFIIGKAWLLYWPLENFGLVPIHPIEAPDPQQVVHAP